MKPFLQALSERVLIQDGAKGSALIARGLPAGTLPDSWNLSHPEVVLEIHRSFVEAGCDILVTNTFGSVRPTLGEYGLQDRLVEINRRGVELAREAGQGRVYVAGSVPPVGPFLDPDGPLSFDQAVEAYREQASTLDQAGVDLFNIETASDLRQTKAAILAIRSVCSKPVVAMMSFGDGDRTLLGTTPQAAAIALEAMGADIIGANCSTGVGEIYRVLLQMSEVSALPKIAQPNAGLPGELDGSLHYPLGPETFAGYVERLVEVGAGILGGCCGTSPAHIRAMRERLESLGEAARPRHSVPLAEGGITWLCSRTAHLGIGGAMPVAIIGERINPTRRKALREAMLRGDFGPVTEEAKRQVAAGAALLDVNVGVGTGESGALMRDALVALERTVQVPLVLDSADPAVLEAGLCQVPGKVLVNSVTAEVGHSNRVLPLVKRYGAAVVGLCLDEQGVPATASGRMAVAERILEAARRHGISRRNLLLDPGTVSVAAQPEQASEVLQTIAWMRQRLKVNTCLGLSNISHGLPDRPALNAAFLAMAVRAGLDAVILDPGQPAVVSSLRASMVLSGRDAGAADFIAAFAGGQGADIPRAKPAAPRDALQAVREALLSGDRGWTLVSVRAALDGGRAPREVLDRGLLPGMDELGRRFKAREVFLPQVMAAAEAMQGAFDLLDPLLQAGGARRGPVVVLATVEGDVHDIGKNIVAAMLRAGGFCVVDLGKSIPADRIVDAANRHDAALIGLSALMTTTMRRMEEVVGLFRERGIRIPILVGGAVVSEGFARSIGAGYAPDAVRAVEVARALTSG